MFDVLMEPNSSTRKSSDANYFCGVRHLGFGGTIRGMETIHTRIKKLRLAKGLSMAALGRQLKVHWQTVQQWENGTSAPKRSRLSAAAAALGVSPQELAHGAPGAAQTSHNHDPRVSEISSLFPLLTEAQKVTLITNVRSMAQHNKSVVEELGKTRPAPKRRQSEKAV